MREPATEDNGALQRSGTARRSPNLRLSGRGKAIGAVIGGIIVGLLLLAALGANATYADSSPGATRLSGPLSLASLTSATPLAAMVTVPRITTFELASSEGIPNVESTAAVFYFVLQPDGASTHWRLEDITKEALDKGEPWTTGDEGVIPDEGVAAGSCEQDCNEHELLHHLAPHTVYDARLVAENAAGAAEPAVVEFTTDPPAAPVIGEIMESEIEGLDGEGFERGPTYATFEARPSFEVHNWPDGIESNGVQTIYRFEYAAAEAGGQAPPESSASWQLFTSGEANGTITVAEDFANPKAKLTGLTHETKYYLRLVAESPLGKVSKIQAFETSPLTPVAGTPARSKVNLLDVRERVR